MLYTNSELSNKPAAPSTAVNLEKSEVQEKE